MKKLLLVMAVMLAAGMFCNAWAAAGESVSVGNVMPDTGALQIKTPQAALDAAVTQIKAAANTLMNIANGTIEVGDTIVADQDVLLWSRNENPITDFGGAYEYMGSVPAGTEMTVLEVTTNIAISRFDNAPEGTHTPVIVMDCVQYKVQLADGTIGYLVEYNPNSFVGAVGRFIFGGANLSEAPSMGAQ